MSGLDAFLELCDADPDWDSSDDDDPFKALDEKCEKEKRASANKPKQPPPTNKDKEITFEQMFGDPIIQKTSIQSKANNTKNLPPVVEQYPSSSNNFQRKSSTTTTLPSQGSIILDPFSKIRMERGSVELTLGDECTSVESSLQGRNVGMTQVGLSGIPRWYRCGGGKDKSPWWTTAVLTRKPPGLRKSSKGNEYSLWEIADLNNVEQGWTVFLFGSAANDSFLARLPVGTLLDFLSPTILEDSASVRMKLSVTNTSQVRRVGLAKDFAYCQSKKKDGNPCTAVVNSFDCPVCIHHAPAEYRKANRSSSKKKNTNDWSNKKVKSSARQHGVMVTDFGPYPAMASKAQEPPAVVSKKQLPVVRMELQDPSNVLKRNHAMMGNHASITFSKEFNSLELPVVKKPTERKSLVLDPLKTRHLTQKDREILEALSNSKSTKNTELPSVLSSPTAGAQNFLKYLNKANNGSPQGSSSSKLSSAGTPSPSTALTMTRETLFSMQKALNYVKEKGPISKKNPNKEKSSQHHPPMKRKLNEDGGQVKSPEETNKKRNGSDGENSEKKANLPEGFEKIVAAKSAHAGLAEELQETDYFEKLERKEAVENKLLNTFAVPTTAVMCRECKYVALSRSDLCKDRGHEVRIVKAIKRFFKCKFCGNRAMSLDRLPKRPCTTCKSSSWLVAPVGREKAGPTLASESLSIRGDEEKFLGSSSGKLFLNI